MRILNVSIQHVALYINTYLHTSMIITKSSSFTDRHTMVHHYVSPCMCSTGISLTLWTKKLFCYKQNKNEKKMFDTGMKLKREKRKKISIHCSSEINTFQDLLQCLSESVRNLHCLLFMLTVWHHESRSRTLETVSPYQHNTVLKLCHLSCIHRNSWSASQFQRNQLNSVFESCFTFVVRLFPLSDST